MSSSSESTREFPANPAVPVTEGRDEGHATMGDSRMTWLVLKNTVVQLGSRGFVALSKFAGYILIARTFGPDRFGEFSLILTLLVFAEAFLDFGYGEIMVREICLEPQHKRRYLAALTATKAVQAILVYALFAGGLIALNYPHALTIAGLLAGIELLFVACAQVYRVLYKANLQMERDALADMFGTAVFLAMLVWICLERGSLNQIFVAYVIGRGIYCVLAVFLGQREYRPSPADFVPQDMKHFFVMALPFGLCLFTAILFNSQDMLMLSKMDSIHSVGMYSLAYRFVHPLVGVAVALMAALFPILSSCWGQNMNRLATVYQQGIDYSIVIGGAVFCGVESSATALISLWGPEAIEAASTLRVLGGAIAVLFVSSMLGPMFIVIGRRWLALALGIAGVVINGVFNLILIPRYSYIGSAIATILTEFLLMLPAFGIVQRAIGVPLRWYILVKTSLCVAAALACVYGVGLWDTLWGAALALAAYAAMMMASGAVTVKQLRMIADSIKSRS